MKLHVIEIKENFRKDGSLCWVCNEERETTEHVMQECKTMNDIIGEGTGKVDIGSIAKEEVEKTVARYRMIRTVFEIERKKRNRYIEHNNKQTKKKKTV